MVDAVGRMGGGKLRMGGVKKVLCWEEGDWEGRGKEIGRREALQHANKR